MSYTKLDSNIINSSIWLEDKDTKILWITMLAMSDQEGYVGAALPGLARNAGLSLEECGAALDKLMQPDPHSRSQFKEGRRVEKVDRGWNIINYKTYRDKDHSSRAKYYREWRIKKRQQDGKVSEDSDTENCCANVVQRYPVSVSVFNTNSLFNNKELISITDDEKFIFELWCEKCGMHPATMRRKLVETIIGGIRDHIHKGVDVLTQFVSNYSGKGPYFAAAFLEWEKIKHESDNEARKTAQISLKRQENMRLLQRLKNPDKVNPGAS